MEGGKRRGWKHERCGLHFLPHELYKFDKMAGWLVNWLDEWKDGWVDGRMDGWGSE